MRIEPFSLVGTHVALEPVGLEHVPDLLAAADTDRSSFGFTNVPADEAAMSAYVEGLRHDAASDAAVPFVQRAGSRVAGCTRFMNLVWWPSHRWPVEVEIGGTWLGAEVQRSPVNTEAKLLLLTHAFEVWDVHRVAICTDARNARSRAAIERIGATFEGILRRHRQSMGHAVEAGVPRDSALYSIVRDEWPDVRAGLRDRLACR